MRISFLAPRLTQAICGIADNTRLLAQAMHEAGVEVGFIHREPRFLGDEFLAGPVDRWVHGAVDLRRCVRRQRPDWLWIQLSGYGYSRWGAAFRLGRALQSLRKAMPGLRMALYAHETHCQPHQLGRKGFWLSPWQRHTAGVAAREMNLVFTSIPKYIRQVVEDYHVPPSKVVRLPIGSNLRHRQLLPDERVKMRLELGWQENEFIAVTFGSAASQVRAFRHCGAFLARAMTTGHLQRVVCLGGLPGSSGAVFDSLPTELRRPGKVTILGQQPDQRVAEILECCDLAFTGFPQPLLAKSSVFAAYVLAGLPALVAAVPSNEALDKANPPVLEADSWDWGQGRSQEFQDLRKTLREFGKAKLTWHSIAQRALTVLESAVQSQNKGREYDDCSCHV
jgi:hypothetical protein